MIYELEEWIIRFFLNKAHFFRKLFCKEYICGGLCEKRCSMLSILGCCYEECPKRKEGSNENR